MPDSVPLVFGQGDKPVIDRDYKLIKELGSGGFGQVWKASGEGTRHVALKIVHLAGLKEAKRELWALRRLDEVQHANLVPVSAAYVIDHARQRLAPEEWDSDLAGALIIVMTLCEKSLDKRLQECRKEGLQGIPLEELLHFMQGAARGLDYLHKPNPSQGRDQAIVHCDIKPLNILITGGEPQICDFGLARVFDTGNTKYTTQIGSIAYMSPEVLLEGKAATPASDQYALAISYVELRTGRLPFGSGEEVSLSDVTSTLINNRHKLDGLEGAERNVIQRAVAREPHKRYASCLAMVESLKAATRERPGRKSSGILGRLLGRSQEPRVPRPSGDAPSRFAPMGPFEPRQDAESAGTLLAEDLQQPAQGRAASAAASDASARQSTAPPSTGLEETAPVVSDSRPRSWSEPSADAVSGKIPRAESRPHSRHPKLLGCSLAASFQVTISIVLLVAGLAVVDHVRNLGGRQRLMSFVESIREGSDPPADVEPLVVVEPPADVDPPVYGDPPVVVEPRVGPVPKPRPAREAKANDLLEAKDFVGVCGLLRELPAGVTKDDAKQLREKATAAWSKELRQRFDEGKFALATELLDKELSMIADTEGARRDWTSTFVDLTTKRDFEEVMRLVNECDPGLVGESRQQCLAKAQPLWMGEFNNRLKPGMFPRAVGFLKEYPPEDFGEKLETYQAGIRAGWLEQIRGIWTSDPENPEAKAALKECGALLAEFPNCTEASLIKARALIEQEGAARAGSEFQAIKESDLPEERLRLHRTLTVIVLGAAADADWDEVRGRLVELDANPIPDDAPPFAKLTKLENSWLNSHREKTLEFLLTRIDRYVDSEKFDDARSELQSAANLTGDEDPRGELGYRRVVVDLGDPQATREQLVAALAEAKQLMPSDPAADWPDRAKVEKLASAMGTLARRSPSTVDPAMLDDAVGLLRAACGRFPFIEDLPQRFAELLSRRTELRIAEPNPPAEDELNQLQTDWERATKAGVPIPIVDAWRAECLVALGKVENADDLLPRVARQVSEDAAFAAYGAYVRALVYNASDRRQSDKVLEALDEAFETAGAKLGILGKQARLPTAARMILDATGQQLPIVGKGKKATEAYLWGTPFASPDDAQRHLRLLSQVEEILADETGGTDPDEQRAQQRRGLEAGLMLAALHHSPPELDLAWSQASKLAALPDSQLGANALPVLASCVRTHLLRADRETVEPADHQVAIGACTRIVGLLPDDVDTVTFYQSVLAPVLAIADPYADGMSETTEHAIDPAVLEEFYAAVGRLIWKRKFTQWPFATTSEGVAEETARLFGWAIHIHGLRHGDNPTKEAAEYYLTCGHATLATHKPDLDLVQTYADKVLELRPESHGANGLLSNIHLTRSRQQLTRAEHLRLLDDAIEVGNRAVENPPQDDPELATWLINLGTAYVERANYTRDLSYLSQKEDLDRAIKCAEQARELESTNPDYPYLILGNAYEDLAWLVRHDVEANYQEAIRSFWTAADTQKYFRAQAIRSLGRCYYKVVVDSHLDPSQWKLRDLDRPGAEEMLEQAGVHLANATREDPSLADAFFYLGLVRLHQEDPAQADASFQLAKDAALEQALPSVGIYAFQWALMAGPGLDTMQPRIKLLEDATGPLADVLHASARSAKVQSLVNDNQFAEALNVIGQAVPDDPSEMNSGHVPLLQQRVRCRNGLLPDNWNWETAQTTLSDAERALELAYTRADLSESLYLTATMRGVIAERVSRSNAEAENGPPADLRGTEMSQLSRAIADILQAVELVPHLEAPTASSRRFFGALFVWQKMTLIRKKELELSREEAQSFVGELRQGIQWADEFIRIPKTLAADKTICEQMKAALETELKLRSQPAPEAE